MDHKSLIDLQIFSIPKYEKAVFGMLFVHLYVYAPYYHLNYWTDFNLIWHLDYPSQAYKNKGPLQGLPNTKF
jgi:hypothetical protein